MSSVQALTPREDTGFTRRRFYLAAIYGFWGLIGAALGAPALIYLLLPPKPRKGVEWIEAGDLRSLAAGPPKELVFRRNRVDGWKVISEKSSAWVVKTGENEIVAFGPQCTHLGCAYHWDDLKKGFLCPCHASVFSPDGRVVSGPAPRPLDRFDVRLENGKLLLGALREQMEPTE
ncbi:MAG: ubiquinol-cytochrome c reductase iron-sulfur subunit [Acidobacteria bacterium]|nr:ubiquinol-cytochrome c reductase iron-sulfur subunit [Acidobacteriota bacterium]